MNNLPKESSGFLVNVLKLVGGTVFAQALTVLILPILARLYAPEALGIAALFLSLGNLIGILACLRYELSIRLPGTDEEASNLFSVSICATLIVTAVTALLIFFANEGIVRLLKAPELGRYLWLLPLLVFIEGIALALNYWNSRSKKFGRLSIAQIASSGVSNTARLGFGFAGHATGGMLVISQILGRFTSTSVLGGQIWRDDKVLFKSSIRGREIFAGVKRYWKFPVFSSGSIFLNTGSRQLVTWILAFFFSPTIVGFYALGRLVLGAPMTFIGRAIAQVFYQKASEEYVSANDLSDVVETVMKRLIFLGMFPFLLLAIIGEDAFSIVFGARWTEAGVFAQILSIAYFFQFVFSPLMILTSVLEKQNIHLLLDFILFVYITIALSIGGIFGDIKLSLGLYAGANVLYYFLFCIWLFSILKMSLVKIGIYILKMLIFCFPLLGIAAMAKWYFCVNPLSILFISFILGIIYYLILFLNDQTLQEPVKELLQSSGLIK